MKSRFPVLLVLSAAIIAVSAGCSAGVATAATSQPAVISTENTSTAAVSTAISSSPPTVTATTTPSAFTSTPVTTTTATGPVVVPPDTAVYPTIINGVTIVIHADGHFAPPIIKIPVGTTVEWQVTDHLSDHAIYGDDGTMWGGVIAWIPLDKTFTVPGTYGYHDIDSMGGNGTVIVY